VITRTLTRYRPAALRRVRSNLCARHCIEAPSELLQRFALLDRVGGNRRGAAAPADIGFSTGVNAALRWRKARGARHLDQPFRAVSLVLLLPRAFRPTREGQLPLRNDDAIGIANQPPDAPACGIIAVPCFDAGYDFSQSAIACRGDEGFV